MNPNMGTLLLCSCAASEHVNVGQRANLNPAVEHEVIAVLRYDKLHKRRAVLISDWLRPVIRPSIKLRPSTIQLAICG